MEKKKQRKENNYKLRVVGGWGVDMGHLRLKFSIFRDDYFNWSPLCQVFAVYASLL